MNDRLRAIRAANRAYDRQDLAWFDLIALSGRQVDAALSAMPTDQLEAVLESRSYNQQIEGTL